MESFLKLAKRIWPGDGDEADVAQRIRLVKVEEGFGFEAGKR